MTDQEDYLKHLNEQNISVVDAKRIMEDNSDVVPVFDINLELTNSSIQGQGVVCKKLVNNKHSFIAYTSIGKRTYLGRYANHAKKPSCKVNFDSQTKTILLRPKDFCR